MPKQVLIATSKSYQFAGDQDGGSILIHQLVSYAPAWFKTVDLLLLRAVDPACDAPPGIRKLDFLDLPGQDGDKFSSRIAGAQAFVDYLNAHGDDYDLIVISHVSNVFGLWQVRETIRRKIVLYPMFTGLSYRLAKENVPDLYIEMERRALALCPTILTPSATEKRQLVDGYHVDPHCIEVIPRGIDRHLFHPRERTLPDNKPLDIVCIGAVRSQKNTLDAIRLLRALADRGVEANLHLAGAIASPDYAEQCRCLVDDLGLKAHVRFHSVLPQHELAALMDRCDFAISVSRWETFGRGIFESVSMGIPTLVYKRLSCVWEHLSEGRGVRGTENTPAAMADSMLELARHPFLYRACSRSALLATRALDEAFIMQQVRAAWQRASAGASLEKEAM